MCDMFVVYSNTIYLATRKLYQNQPWVKFPMQSAIYAVGPYAERFKSIPYEAPLG